MAATKRNAMLIEEARQKIQTTQLINRLQKHALGEVEMSKTQVTATSILLRKTLPDLSESQNINITQRVADLSDDELAGIVAASGSGGNPETESDTPILN